MNFSEFYFIESSTMIPSELKKARPNKFGPFRANIIIGKLKENPVFIVVDGEKTKEVKLSGDIKKIQKLIDDEKWEELANFELIDDKSGKSYKVKSIAKTKDFGGLGSTPRAGDYEKAIVEVWNGEKLSKNELQKPAEEIVERLRKQISAKETAEHIGSKTLPSSALSDFWKIGTFQTDRTPKPDIRIGARNISLKVGKAAQLCSAKIVGGEGNRLIMSSLEGTNVAKEIRKEIEEMISLRSERKGKNKGVTFFHRGTKEDESKFTAEYFEEQHRKLTKLLNEECQGTDFKRNFIYEAMTGRKKFDDPNGVATYLLATLHDGTRINFKPMDKLDLNQIVQQSKLYVSFKTSGPIHHSAIRITTSQKESQEILLKYFEEKASAIGIDYKTLNEGVIDWLKKIANIIKEAFQKGLDFVFKLFGIELDKFELEQDGYDFLDV